MRRYSRIDSLRCHVLDIHLKKTSRHDYGLRSLAQPHTDAPTEDGPIICPDPAHGGLVLQGRNHYKNQLSEGTQGAFLQEFDNSDSLSQLPQTSLLSSFASPHLSFNAPHLLYRARLWLLVKERDSESERLALAEPVYHKKLLIAAFIVHISIHQHAASSGVISSGIMAKPHGN